jgi:hypothetical protein
VKCFVCGNIGQKSWECPDRKRDGGGEAHISEGRGEMLRQKMQKVENP